MEDIACDNLEKGGGGQNSHNENDNVKNSPIDNTSYLSQNLILITRKIFTK